MSTRLFDLPLGARFQYEGRPERTYVLLDRARCGLVADAQCGTAPHAFQGMYSATETRQEFESLMVEVVPTQEGATARTVLSYADLRRAERECAPNETVTTALGFLFALRRGADSRDEFALAALPAAMTASWRDLDFRPTDGLTYMQNCAVLAYQMADAMLKARAT